MDNMQNKKRIFQILQDRIKAQPKVMSYLDESENYKVDLYIGNDRPDIGIVTYSTIGLSEYSIDLIDQRNREIRVEFIGVCNSEIPQFPNIIASCAFNIMKDHYSCRPGMVNPNIIEEYYSGLEMKHIYYTIPYLWNDLQGLEMDDHIVNWLLAMPISDNEWTYLQENGIDRFEDLLEQNDVDIFDINRKSIL